MARKDPTAWRSTPEGLAKYETMRAAAQQLANEHGYDIGIECNDLFKTWRSMALPMRQHRQGFELACEVVMCEDLDRCQPGHGPRALSEHCEREQAIGRHNRIGGGK
jgi:hypothetical protein